MIEPLSLKRFETDFDGFSARLGADFEEIGFAVISDLDLDPAMIARAYDATKAFFALAGAEKRTYHQVGGAGQRGYTPFGIETAKGAHQSDLKEFWHVGREIGAEPVGPMQPNLWPKAPPEFRPAVYGVFDAMDQLGAKLLRAVARHLNLSLNFFDDPTRNGNSILRLLHYPPLSQDAHGVRAAAHEDINVITLLLGAEEAGLQVRHRSGDWIDIQPPPGALVCNIGDMLQRLTNHVLPSTSHRVVNPTSARAGHSRYSLPFFLHFRPDYRIETLPGCISADRPNRYPEPITAQAYLEERLRDLKL